MSNTALISDFNIDVLGRQLASKHSELVIGETVFGQAMQSLNKAISDEGIDNVIVWVRPESLSAKYNAALQFKGYELSVIEEEIAFFFNALEKLAASKKHVFFVNFALPTNYRGLGAGDFKPQQGLAFLCNSLNNTAYNRLAGLSNVYILDQQRWFARAHSVFNSKLYYAGKIVYSPEVFELAAADIIAALLAAEGKSRRLIVVDLDNTMWGGILGDTGVDGLNLGGHNFQGEAFVDFQRGLKALRNRGVLLAIASKNYEENALNAIENHPEMVLRKEDFVTWQINWEDKANNIVKIANKVNLGLSSVVFLDDNPAERGRVKEALPEVMVPEWPVDPTDYLQCLQALSCFDSVGVSTEDIRRSEMFAEQENRQNLRESVSSDQEWLASIGMVLSIEEVNSESLPRTLQLLNKTNQFNLKTRRLSESQFTEWLDLPNNFLWTIRVKDKFGDSGLTGIFSISCNEGTANIEDFILSCRVMGRSIEDVMLAKVIAYSLDRGCEIVNVEYLETDRNRPIREFLNDSNVVQSEGVFHFWKGTEAPSYPSYINIDS